jgi:hypothetical protein
VDCLFCGLFPLLCWSFLVWWSPICQFFLLIAELLEFCS